jgi:alpha-tubulin suppressor-like RCC1 family protein
MYPVRESTTALLIIATFACGEGGGVTTPLPVAATPQTLEIAAGDGQRVLLGGALPEPLQVRVIGSDQKPLPAITVDWSVTQGEGAVDPPRSTTDAAGQSRTQVTVGGTAGTIVVRASVDQLAPVNFSLTVTAPAPAPPSGRLTTGSRHTCRLLGERLWCWGNNDSGQLGDGTTVTRLTPVLVAGDLSFAEVTAGGSHTCGITNDAFTYCWGSNAKGQLGDGTTLDSHSPQLVAAAVGFTQVSAGGSHSCGLSNLGTVYCWGWNSKGQLGDGTMEDRHSPNRVLGGVEFVSLTVGDAASEAGGEFSCGVTAPGTTYCWGRNFSGQLGDGSGMTQLTPVRVAGDLSFDLVSGGGSHACALSGTSAFCWGTYGLGNGTQSTTFGPGPVTGGLSFLSVSAGGHHTCGLADGGIACWGHNDFGQLGDGTTTEALSPVPVTGSEGFIEVSAGGKHSCAATATGETYCWGSNEYGQLGDGSTTDRPAPTPVVLRLCCQMNTGADERRPALLCACALD